MRRFLFVAAAAGIAGGWFVTWWRDHRRFGAAAVNRLVNPWLLRQGVPAASRDNIALLEHVGRRSGTVRVTPVHPEHILDGYRIIVPLGTDSQWARNVVAAGHCRLQVGDTVHDLDEPCLLPPSQVDGVPRRFGRVLDWLGFRYLVLHEFDAHVGSLERTEPRPEPAAHTAPARRERPHAARRRNLEPVAST